MDFANDNAVHCSCAMRLALDTVRAAELNLVAAQLAGVRLPGARAEICIEQATKTLDLARQAVNLLERAESAARAAAIPLT